MEDKVYKNEELVLLFKKYFNVSIINEPFKLKINLKPEFKKEVTKEDKELTPNLLRGGTKEYYKFCLGDEIGGLVYHLRKIVKNPKKQVEFFIENNLCENEEFKKKLILKSKNYSVTLSEANKKKWADEKYKSIEVEKMKITAKGLERRLKVRAGLQKYWESDNSLEHRNKLNKNQYSLLKRKVNENLCRENKNLIITIEDGKKINDIEFMIYSCLKNLDIKFEVEKLIVLQGHHYFPDFYLPDYNLVVEVYGDYWHRNPKFFDNSDIETVTIRDKDRLRQEKFTENNYLYTYFWENQIRNNLDMVYKFLLKLKK